RGTMTVIGANIRASTGVSVYGASAVLDGVKVIGDGAGAGFRFGTGGVVVSNTPTTVEARNFDILTGVDYDTGLANGSASAYGIQTGSGAFVSLERGNVETWGKYSTGIWATGDN